MAATHKNKTFATLLASLLGGFGLHRFYLYGKKDVWGWVHFLTVPVSYLATMANGDSGLAMFAAYPFVLSVLAAFIEALVIGLTSDEQWDLRHNTQSTRKSDSRWPLAVLLVLTTGAGATAIIATMARTFDLLYTGGSFG